MAHPPSRRQISGAGLPVAAARLVSTKLRPPSAPSALLRRSRLAELLGDLEGRTVVLVHAPAGYGKTTVMAQWYAELRSRGARCGWLTLDEDDDRPSRLLLHLAAALLTDDPRRSASLDALGADLQVAPASIGLLVDGLPGLDPPFALFVDELEHVASESAALVLRRLVERQPERSIVVLASRTRPPVGLARLRVERRLVEIGVDELRFGEKETSDFFAACGTSLTRLEIEQVRARTEGWAAAVHLSALALGARRDRSGLLRTLALAEGDVAAYLAEDVLDRQPRAVRRFLLDTSILRRLCGELCDAVTGRRGGAATLERLAEAGLFLTALDAERRWYRYHPLFARLLEERLRRSNPRRLARLHRSAARWHARRSLALDAVHHALAARDLPLAARLMEGVARELNRQGQFSTVIHWSRTLPARWLDARPAIRAAAAWAHLFHREFDEAGRHLAALARKSRRRALDRRVEDDVAIVAPIMAGHRDHIAETLERSRVSLARLAAADPFNRGVVRDSLAYGLVAAGRFEEARAVLLEARSDHARAGSLLGAVYTLALDGLRESAQGRLSAAHALFREAETLARRDGDGAPSHLEAIALGYASEVLYERDELGEVERRMELHLSLAVESAVVDMVIVAYLVAARTAFARGARDDAHRRLREAEVTAAARSWPRLCAAARWEAVGFALAEGSLAEARRLRARITPELEHAEERPLRPHAGETEAQEIGDLRLRVRGGRARRALAAIRAERRAARSEGRGWRALRLAVLEVEALDALGDHAGALRTLREALRDGAAERFVRSFADAGRPITRLVRELAAAADPALAPEYLDAILMAAGERGAERIPAPAPAVERLSLREREILSLLAEGLSNRSIAARLFVSENTVKFHLKAVFAKLGATTRAGAAATARRVGLLAAP